MLFVAATACTRVTTGYSIDLLFFLAISVLLCLKVIKVRKNSRIVYHSTLPFMFCSDITPMFAGFYCIRIAFSPFSHTYSHEFGMLQSLRTCSNHCLIEGTSLHRIVSHEFEGTEPHRLHKLVTQPVQRG